MREEPGRRRADGTLGAMAPKETLPAGRPPSGAPAPVPDLSTACLACGEPMRPEHAHYRCPACGWRDSCCDGPY